MTYRFDKELRRNVAGRCAAFSRLEAGDTKSPLKRAAVAIALVAMDDGTQSAAFLLTRRAPRLRSHAGQWALPGGRCDEGETAAAAVLRELDEELGLKLTDADMLGVLDDYPTRSGYLITPIVLWAGADPKLRPSPQEVASVHRIPLQDIARVDAVDFIASPDSVRQVVRMKIGASLVHAPTAAMLYQFREILAGRDTRVADLEQPLFAWR